MNTVWLVVEDTSDDADCTRGVFSTEQKATAYWREKMAEYYGEDEDEWPPIDDAYKEGFSEPCRFLVRDHIVE